MTSLDSFVGIPLLVSAGLSFVVLALLIISKIRNTSKISNIVFPALGIYTAAALFMYFKPSVFIFTAALILILLFIAVYALVLALSDPNKKQTRRHLSKDEAEALAIEEKINNLQNEVNNSQKVIAANKELTVKAASFFESDDTLANFLEYFSKSITEKTTADGCAILMMEEEDNMLAVKSVSGSFPPPYKLPEDLPHKPIRIETNFKFSQFATEGNIFGDIFTSGEAINVVNPAKEKRIFQNEPEDFLKCGPYIFVPVKMAGASVGVIALSRKPDSDPFTQEDFENALSLTDALSTALQPLNSFLSHTEHMELTKEGDIATKYQATLVPEKLPVINQLSIGKYTNCVENVCGDYYDIIPSRKDRISFVMSDVAGKGMTSLTIMIMIRAMIRLVANTNQSSATLLEWINKAICSEKNSMDHFASVALINYNSIDNTAQIATSGINPVIHYKAADESIEKISTDCEPIGVEKTTTYTDIDVKLESGDILITCTDGLIECLNEAGAQYSLDNLKQVIKANCKLNGKDIAAKVKDNIKKFCGNAQQYDDQSLLIVKIQG